MFRLLKRTGLIALLAGAAPLATIANCNRTPDGGGQAYITSSNENLLADVIDLLFDHDDDDD
ncbi:MAG TPA: hypothetical protein VM243_12200 [Phycisphaerae bacterium]|nr:hypothetical protein [Phycisphaerae bacterium]